MSSEGLYSMLDSKYAHATSNSDIDACADKVSLTGKPSIIVNLEESSSLDGKLRPALAVTYRSIPFILNVVCTYNSIEKKSIIKA